MSGEMKAVSSEEAFAFTAEAGKDTRKVSVHELPIAKSRPELPSLPSINEDERTRSQKTQARAFDDLVSANLKLIKSTDKLIRSSYMIQMTQLFLIIMQLVLIALMFYQTIRKH